MAEIITLEQAKQHLNWDMSNNEKDEQIKDKIKEALRHVRDYIDRPFTDAICRDYEDPSLLSPALISAAKLILGDLMENELAQQGQVLNINMTCQNLMNPYRKWGV